MLYLLYFSFSFIFFSFFIKSEINQCSCSKNKICVFPNVGTCTTYRYNQDFLSPLIGPMLIKHTKSLIQWNFNLDFANISIWFLCSTNSHKILIVIFLPWKINSTGTKWQCSVSHAMCLYAMCTRVGFQLPCTCRISSRGKCGLDNIRPDRIFWDMDRDLNFQLVFVTLSISIKEK